MKTTRTEINGQITVCLDDENGTLTWMPEEAYADYLIKAEQSTPMVADE
jgi:hypothetical protein